MIGKAFLGSLAVLSSATLAQAAVTIETTSIDTPGLPGFKTWTVTAVSTDPITAIDFVGDGRNDASTGKGFFGTMNQLAHSVISTIFEDSNPLIQILFPGANAKQDSHFSVLSTAVVIPPGLAEEGPNLLQAAWAWSAPQRTSEQIAQLVVPANRSVGFRGTVTALVDGVQTDFAVSGHDFSQFPPVVADADLGARQAGLRVSHSFTTPQSGDPLWGDLVVTTPGGSSPVNAPALTTTGQFTWQSALTDKLGTYTFEVKASNMSGSDVGQLTVLLVPEPSVCVLVSMGGIGMLCRSRDSKRNAVSSR